MDCRKFHRILEDYLEDDLDFSGRFGMERHAQQCIGCGKVLANAQRLRRMASQLERVRAPENFEAAVLNRIGKWEMHGPFSGFRRFWLYGFDMPSVRKLVLITSCSAVLIIAALYLYPTLMDRTAPEGSAAQVFPELETSDGGSMPAPETTAVAAQPVPPLPVEVPQIRKIRKSSEQAYDQMVDQEVTDSDYLEFQVIGPDNRPITFRWPTRYRVRYGQTPEEYFLRNVSH
jgi:hypothetical protein